jgi:hypothetical protein
MRLLLGFEATLADVANECVSVLLDSMNRNVYPYYMEIKW